MNLIEQLGGYECAKAEHDDPMYEDGELYTIKATGARFFKHNLADELLEYRRQHNIFEEGDWVVMPSRGNGIFQVSRLLCRSDMQEMIHATPEEIKAGKRLEVKSDS